MINYMHNTQILIVLPQNCTYYYYYDHIRGHGYFNNSELKDMLDELSSQILNDLCNILGVMRLNYENTLTKIGNKEYKAAFYFQVNDGILKSKKSNKSTVVRLHNIGYATTLEIHIVKTGVTKLDVDCVVNATNEGLWAGGTKSSC